MAGTEILDWCSSSLWDRLKVTFISVLLCEVVSIGAFVHTLVGRLVVSSITDRRKMKITSATDSTILIL